jgi:hypothetical protein
MDSRTTAENLTRALGLENRTITAIAATAGATLAVSLGYAQLASRGSRHSLSGAVLRMALRATWREARATAKDGRLRVLAKVSRR